MSERAELVVPELGESITEAVIGRWLKQVGESVDADEPVVDLETDKITVQLPAPAAGALAEQRYAEGQTVKVGDVVGRIELGANDQAASRGDGVAGRGHAQKAAATKEAAAAKEVPKLEAVAEETRLTAKAARAATTPASQAPWPRRLTPAQRRAARSSLVAVPAHEGTAAPSAAAAKRPAAAAQIAAAAKAAGSEPGRATARFEDAGREDIVPMSPLRKRIAERLVQAQHSSASLTTFNEVDMSAVMALRDRYKESFQDSHGVKLGFMSFFVKATVAALKLFPGLNAEVRDGSIAYKKFYDLGIAVGTDKGLIVPVLRDADQRSFAEIEAGITELAEKATKGTLALDDLVGGTFTITNGGIYGSMLSTPLLNYPQTGILGMHNIKKRPVVLGDQVAVRPVMYVALTYDHRVVDGREAVQFLVAIKERIESPDRLMFEL